MGERHVVLGCIIEPHIVSLETRSFVESHNSATLFNLREDDSYPPILKSFFATTQHESMGSYRGRVIHFGASLKTLGEDWDEWIGKFENLLRELVWIEAWVKADLTYYGQRNLIYIAQDEIIQSFWTDKPQKTSSWLTEKRFV
jgi:hypothetical protein